MASFEQLIYGTPAGAERGREVLGRSPGLSEDVVEEVVKLCEGWGAVPSGGLKCPVILSFPLVVHLAGMPGDLYTVIRITEGLKPIYHALVLSRPDYEVFDLNPYSMVQEGLFLDTWNSRESLAKREVSPSSLSPLISPLPSEGDCGSTDEALRQMLANKRLLLPLERSAPESDRFLALLIATLPRVLRRDLRFASWAPSGTNRYSLAATYREAAPFTSWAPFLMTSVVGKLNESCEDFIDEVKVCLRNGDLTGLDKLGSSASVDISRSLASPTRNKTQTLSASVDEKAAQRIKSRSTANKPTRPAVQSTGSAPRHIASPSAANKGNRPRARARARAVKRPRKGRARRGFAMLLSFAILLAGAYYLWTAGHWTRLPSFAAGDVRLQTDPDHGVVDIAVVYRQALDDVSRGSAGLESLDLTSRRRGLETLQQAGQLLEAQGRGFLDEANQTLTGKVRGSVDPAPASRLHERGKVLARELRRLALARVALEEHIDWRDLADLDARAVQARHDSLMARRRVQGTLEPPLVEVDRLLQGFEVTVRQVGGLAALEDLLAAGRWDTNWNRRCARAIDDLLSVRQDRARLVRDEAQALLRLKRAEHGSNQDERAFVSDFINDERVTDAVRQRIPELVKRATKGSSLVGATLDFYRKLELTTAADITPERLAKLADDLAANRAVEFDPLIYDSHVARLRFQALEMAALNDDTDESLTTSLVDDFDQREMMVFLAARQAVPGAAGWRAISQDLTDPFLLRWANYNASALETTLNHRQNMFLAELKDLDNHRQTLLRRAESGGDCGAAWLSLQARTVRIREAYRGAFTEGSKAKAAWNQVDRLVQVLDQPPVLSLSGVTVRLDNDVATTPRDVVVELVAEGTPTLQTEPLHLGPAAPAGTGWVGSTSLAWSRELTTGTPMQVRVLDAESGVELIRLDCQGWLQDWTPQDLRGLSSDRGIKVSWRLEKGYWGDLDLPELGS